jgi:asparagine synthase (glutamine-hydrolysing)
VSQAVKSNATVLLTGDGGDDVFLGYSFFYNAWKAEKLARRLPPGSAAAWSAIRPAARKLPAFRRAANFLDYATGGFGPYARIRSGLSYFEERNISGEMLRGCSLPYRQIPSSFSSAQHLVKDVVVFHRGLHFLSEFMPKVDGGTMYYSLEARSPFLDQAVWEFAARLPPGIHFHGQRLKAVLREIARRHLGPGVAFGEKRGFTIPAERWLASKWSHHLRDLKNESLLVRQGWMNAPGLSAAIDEAISRNEVPKQLWYALVLEHWLRRGKTRTSPGLVSALETSARL